MAEHSRNTTYFVEGANESGYVPANKMLDLRLLNASSVSVPSAMQSNMQSNKSSKIKSSGNKNDPVEIMSFKQVPSKRNYGQLNSSTLWNSNPLNKKYNLELTEETLEAPTKRRAGRALLDEPEGEERKSIDRTDELEKDQP